MTKALILAAGRGRRMGKLTDESPKALLRVAGKPLLRHALENLSAAGIAEVAVVTGYQAESLCWPEFAQNFNNPDWETTQMVYSLFQANEWLCASDTIVCYSDILFTPGTIEKLVACPGDIALTNNVNWRDVWVKRFADPLVDAETFKRDQYGVLTEIGKRPKSMDDIQGQYMGLLKITPKGWNEFIRFRQTLDIDRFRKIDMTSTINELIQRGVRVSSVDVHESWYEFDSEDDLRSYT